jgi:hypothetical protein
MSNKPASALLVAFRDAVSTVGAVGLRPKNLI